MNRKLQELLVKQQQEALFHKSLGDEFDFYKDVQNGNLEILQGAMDIEPTSEMGILSENHMRNMKYHLIILIAMLTRFCVEGGMDSETAYTMSDMYIRRIDLSPSENNLHNIKKEAITDYTLAMHNLKNNLSVSYHVYQASEYIKHHLTEPVSIQTLAKATRTHPDYLNRLFKQELNISISQYILQQKCVLAQYMLANSNISCGEIGMFLGFSSASHFTKRFKSHTGKTPAEYRKSCFNHTISKFNANK